MNRIFSLATICILLSLLFSCKKSGPLGNGGTITATINGVSYTSASVSGEAHPTGGKSFSIFTSTDNTHANSIILYVDSLAPGIYAYNPGSGNAIQYNRAGLTYGTIPGSSGSILITSTGSNSITGTFNGVLGFGTVDSIVITDGVFTNLTY